MIPARPRSSDAFRLIHSRTDRLFARRAWHRPTGDRPPADWRPAWTEYLGYLIGGPALLLVLGSLWLAGCDLRAPRPADHLATARGPACTWTDGQGALCTNAAVYRGQYCHQHTPPLKP